MNRGLSVPFDVKLMNITATVLFMGCLMLGVAAMGWWLMRYPAFNIGRIVVEGEFVQLIKRAHWVDGRRTGWLGWRWRGGFSWG